MKVYFIGAGPGAADLLTVRAARILSEVPLILYAGSLVPEEVISYCREQAQRIDTAALTLDEQVEHYREAHRQGWDVARVHSGDPTIYGATGEQMRRLDELGIDYELVPGVSSFVAGAAALKTELTKPEVSQTIILTRSSGRASPVPENESLERLASHRATLCVFLSGAKLTEVVQQLSRHYPSSTPVALAHKVEWPQQQLYQGELGRILEEVKPSEWRLSTLLLVGRVLGTESGPESRLYSNEYSHRYRKAKSGDRALEGG